MCPVQRQVKSPPRMSAVRTDGRRHRGTSGLQSLESESTMTSTVASYREITDANGRVYRVGETDRDLLGRSRASMVWLPWIAMMAGSVFGYGYGAPPPTPPPAPRRG